MKRHLSRVAVVSAVAMLTLTLSWVVASPSAASSSTFVVDSTGDQPDETLDDLVCRTAAGTCTLRAAMAQAAKNPGPNRIEFDIAGAGPHKIIAGSLLPVLSDQTGGTTIDGYTQPGSSPNTATVGSNAVIKIEISTNGTMEHGLHITSPENVIRGIAINRFYMNIKLEGEQADGNRIIGNFVGPTATGEQAATGSIFGFKVELGASQNIIGTPALADRNVISGNNSQGLRINHGETSENLVQNNVIGLKPDLSDRLIQKTGLDLQWWTWGNLIGGFEPGEGNLISGNQRTTDTFTGGVDLSHTSTANLVVGNYFGTLGDGNTVTAYSRNVQGIVIKDNARLNYIADNVIANSMYWGIKHRDDYTGPNTIVNNRIGVGVNGAAIGNPAGGAQVNGHDIVYRDNIVANNGGPAFQVIDTYPIGNHTNYPQEKTERNTISQNTIYNNGALADGVTEIDITPDGRNVNDVGDVDNGPNTTLNHPVVTGRGPGQLQGTACSGCTVEVYTTGTVIAGGDLDPASTGGVGQVWIGRAVASATGQWSFGSLLLESGKRASLLAIDSVGNTSEMLVGVNIPATPTGIVGAVEPSLGRLGQPDPPAMPRPYEPRDLGLITGTVSFTGGDPVSGVGVQLFTEAAGGGRGTWVSSTTTSASGQYSVYPPSDGCWVITFVAPAGEVFSVNESGWLNQGVCLENGVATLDVEVLDATALASVAGSVIQDGAGVADVGVDLFTSSGQGNRGQWTESTRTAADGSFSFVVSPGCWALTFKAPAGEVFTNGSAYINSFFCVDGGASEVVSPVELVGLTSRAITGTVSLSTGGPVAGAGVQLFTQTAGGGRGTWVASTSTDAAGAYSLTPPTDGCWVITFVAPDGSQFVENGSSWLNEGACLVDGEAVVDAVVLDAAGQATVTGTVTSAGEPVAGVGIDLFTSSGDGDRGQWVRSTVTVADGTFGFEMAPGCWALTYKAPAGQVFSNGSRYLNRFFCVAAGEGVAVPDVTLSAG